MPKTTNEGTHNSANTIFLPVITFSSLLFSLVFHQFIKELFQMIVPDADEV